MGFCTFVSAKLSFRPDSEKKSIGPLIAVMGVALSFIVVALSLAVVKGFKNQIINKLQGFTSQITVTATVESPDGIIAAPIVLDENTRSTILDIIPDAKLALTITQPIVLKTDSAFQGLVLKGLDTTWQWDFIKSNISAGEIPDPDDSASHQTIIISTLTANALGLNIGDKTPVHFFDGNELRIRPLKVAAIYDSHFSDFDKTLAFTPICMLQDFFKIDSISGTSIEIEGLKFANIGQAANALQRQFFSHPIQPGKSYRVDSILTQCAMYLNWLNLLDTNVVVIMVLMICVAGFTLVSSLFILILERVNMIGLMKSLGATNSQIRRIFILMAERLVLRGLLIGNIVALSIILLQQHLHIVPLDPEAYYLNYVPMEFNISTWVMLNIGVIAVSLTVLIGPSHMVSTLSPIKTLKYE